MNVYYKVTYRQWCKTNQLPVNPTEVKPDDTYYDHTYNYMF